MGNAVRAALVRARLRDVLCELKRAAHAVGGIMHHEPGDVRIILDGVLDDLLDRQMDVGEAVDRADGECMDQVLERARTSLDNAARCLRHEYPTAAHRIDVL